jgi:molecular chaperone DnaK (HSP70)
MEITIENLREKLLDLTHRQQVEVAIHCAEDVFPFNSDKTRESAKKCIDLVKKWLKDPDSVTEEELKSIGKYIEDLDSYESNAAADSAYAAAAAAFKTHSSDFAAFFADYANYCSVKASVKAYADAVNEQHRNYVYKLRRT